MSRAVLIYITLAAIFILFLLSSSPRNHTGPRRHARRLKLRGNVTFPSPTPDGGRHHDLHQPVAFDPLVADLERRREDREWEREHYSIPAPGHEPQPEWEDFMDAEDYINDEARFNVTDRILVLFPKIDQNPSDGFVSVVELMEWNLRQAEKEVLHRTQRDMDLHDKNHDGLVSLEEYEPPSWAYHSGDNDPSNQHLGWWKAEHFNASDIDGDGFLNLTEFNDFLHPADSSNPKLMNWLCKEEIRERDKDKDGKLNFQEFFNGLFDSIRDYNELDSFSDQTNSTMEAPAKRKFSELDKDKDGFLTAEEIKPVIGSIHPSERYYAKQQAEHTMSEADANKDGRLSLNEMIENPYAFYSAIFSDEDEDFPYHDEFR